MPHLVAILFRALVPPPKQVAVKKLRLAKASDEHTE